MKSYLMSRIVLAGILASLTGLYSLVISGKYGVMPIPIGVGFVLVSLLFLLRKFDLAGEIADFAAFKYKKTVYVCTILSIVSFMHQFSTTMDTVFLRTGNRTLIAVAIVSALAIVSAGFFVLWYALLNRYMERFVAWIAGFGLTERRGVIVYVVLFAVVNFVVLLRTSAFIYPVDSHGDYVVDVVFTTDSAKLLDGRDVFSSPNTDENDFRQLLFGITAFPLSMVSLPLAYAMHGALSALHSAVPFETIYGYFISIGQALLFAISALLIRRLLMREMSEGFANLFALLYVVSFSTILYTMTIEQYAVSLIALLAFVYCYATRRSSAVPFIVAGTTLTTSFLMLPLVLFERKGDWRTYVLKMVRIVVATLFALIFFGQLYELLEGSDQLRHLVTKFATGEGVTIADKLVQYYQFLPSMFVAPDTAMTDGMLRLGEAGTAYGYASAGIALCTLAGFVYAKRSRLAAAAAYWVVISFVLLGIVGWGTVERSLVLYVSYFGWAFLALIAIVYAKAFERHPIVGKLLLAAVVLAVFSFNVHHIAQYVSDLGSFRAE